MSIEEWNFRDLLKDHLISLLEQQRVYWKQRDAIKWIKLRDAGTSFFHAAATIRHRGNLISELMTREGNLVSELKDK